MAVLTAVLTVVYISFRTREEKTRQYQVPAAQCVKIAQRVRQNVKVGKVKVFCNGRKI